MPLASPASARLLRLPGGLEGALAQTDLGDVADDRGGELDGAARGEGEVERGVRAVDAAVWRAAPHAAARVGAGDRAGPAVADRVAALEVVDAGGLGAFLELAAVADELAPADDGRRRAEHEVILEVAAVARVKAREDEVAAVSGPDAPPRRRHRANVRRGGRGRAARRRGRPGGSAALRWRWRGRWRRRRLGDLLRVEDVGAESEEVVGVELRARAWIAGGGLPGVLGDH